MTAKKYNFPPELLTAIEKENLIVFVGAGLSRELKNVNDQEIGNWDNLVLQILKNLKNDDTDLLIPLVGKFDPVDILDLLEKNKNVNVGNVKDFTKSFFDLHSENDLSVHKKICKLTDQIITTNYDCAFEEANSKLRKNIAHTGNKHELVNFTKSNFPTLFKLHGTYERSDSMILFSSDYDTLYVNPDSDAELTLLTLRNTILNKTVLFIGCSMGDFQINELFQYIKKLKGIYNQKHFIITKDTLDSSLEFLEAITIEDHDEIPEVVEQLLKEKEQFTNQKTPEQELLEKQLEEVEQERLDLEEKLKETLSDSQRKDILLKREALKYFKRGFDFSRNKEHEKASHEYEIASELNPTRYTYNNWGNAIINLAIDKEDKKLFTKAIEKYNAAIKLDSKYPLAYSNLGRALISLTRITQDEKLFIEALEKYKVSFELNTENKNYFFHKKHVLKHLAQFVKQSKNKEFLRKVFEKYLKTMKVNIINQSSSMSLGYVLTEIANEESDEDLFLIALKEFKKEEKLDSKNHTNYSDWGFALSAFFEIKQDCKLLKQACKKFEKAVELDNTNHYTYIYWGKALSDLGIKEKNFKKIHLASEKYEKAKELNSEDYNLYQKWGDNLFFLANLKGEVSIYEESLEKYEKALGINENGYHALIGRKLILFRLARLGKNTESFKRTKEKYEEFIKKYSKSELVRIGDTEFIAAIYELEHNYNHSH